MFTVYGVLQRAVVHRLSPRLQQLAEPLAECSFVRRLRRHRCVPRHHRLARQPGPSAGHDGATDAAGRRAVRAAFHLGARAQARLRQRARYAAAPAKGTDARVARRERPRHAAGAGRLDLVQPNILSDGPAHRLRRRRHPAPVLLLHPSQQREHVLVLVVARETEGRVVTAAIGRVGASLKQ